MAKAAKKSKATDEQAESTQPETATQKADEHSRMLSWSLGGGEKTKFPVRRPRTIADMLDPNFGGRNGVPFATSEQAIVDKAFGQGCVELRRQAIDAGLFGTEEEPKSPSAEAAFEFYQSHSIGETGVGRTRTAKVAKAKAEDLPEDPAERLARLEALFVEK